MNFLVRHIVLDVFENFLQELSVFFHSPSPSFRDFLHYTPPPRRGQAACPARALGLSAAKQENARRQKASGQILRFRITAYSF